MHVHVYIHTKYITSHIQYIGMTVGTGVCVCVCVCVCVQVYILKRMGGMLDSCHTCRLMDLEHVRGMCSHYGLSLPDTLNSLCRNELPKGRKGIRTCIHVATHTVYTCTVYISQFSGRKLSALKSSVCALHQAINVNESSVYAFVTMYTLNLNLFKLLKLESRLNI